MKNSKRSELYRLLCLAEDYALDGYRREHPRLVVDATATGTAPPPAGASPPPAGASPAPDSLERLAAEVVGCVRCGLHERRTRAVPGEGASRPRVLVVGEGPGFEEDRTGRPFVGPAGQYLDRWLKAVELDRSTGCFITNIVKCRPPGNRDPLPEESEACRPFLERQVALLRPQAILTVGRISTQILTGRSIGIGALRGQVYEYRGIPLVGTYHPSAVLRNPALRKPVWEDLKLLRSVLDRRGSDG